MAITSKELEQVLRALTLEALGQSEEEIAEELGLSTECVQQWVGLAHTVRTRECFKAQGMTARRKDKIGIVALALRVVVDNRCGMDPDQIAERWGVPLEHVQEWLREWRYQMTRAFRERR